MSPVIRFTVSDPTIGIIIRPTRQGPETDLILRYIQRETALLLNQQRSYALFLEPQLDTGFPDIVLVSFNPKVFNRWKPDRDKINNTDIKILHHMHFTGKENENSIEEKLGISKKEVTSSFERLQSADLVKKGKNTWFPRSLRSTFSVTNIKAIEAKVKNWKDAFEQADINRWFASESYILSPIEKPTSQIVETSKEYGIGLYIMPDGSIPKRIAIAAKNKVPSSYASWLFNEWIGRYLNQKRG